MDIVNCFIPTSPVPTKPATEWDFMPTYYAVGQSAFLSQKYSHGSKTLIWISFITSVVDGTCNKKKQWP